MTVSSYPTPYELGNHNQTSALEQCLAFYQRLAGDFPEHLKLFPIGLSDGGIPIHAGVITADGVFDRATLQAEQRTVFFNNNGIHPGEPEGIDGCIALVRDFCIDPAKRAALGRTVFLFIPVYNVDGMRNRADTSRVNQQGPEQFGFRANDRHLDLNRDFIKCDSLAAQAFNQFFASWRPHVMVDTHTSNGADYQYTMTLIQTQADKLGGELGEFLRHTMLPKLFADMAQRGWPMCPYVNPIEDTPDAGIVDFLETPRFSTGYAALHHCIGFMPETHMLKPFQDRYESMRALVQTVLDFTIANHDTIYQLRAKIEAQSAAQKQWPLRWKPSSHQPTRFRFRGYTALRSPSKIGRYQRLSYDRNQPWEKEIPYHEFFEPEASVIVPNAYLIPQCWREAIERLRWNGVALKQMDRDQRFNAKCYRIESVQSREDAYEGHLFHDHIEMSTHTESIQAYAGDWIVTLAQPRARYAVECLEPQSHDSYFRWGFFNSVLQKKEGYSDYVFEDTAAELLTSEPGLKAQFEQWQLAHPELLDDQTAVLDFLYHHAKRFAEPEWKRYPVFGLMD
jgi:Zinc carboxypeptidase